MPNNNDDDDENIFKCSIQLGTFIWRNYNDHKNNKHWKMIVWWATMLYYAMPFDDIDDGTKVTH